MASGKILQRLTGHTEYVYSAAFSGNGEMVASGSGDKLVRFWSASDGRLVHLLTGHEDEVNAVAFSPDGVLLASASDDATIRLWCPAACQTVCCLTGHTDNVRSVAFSPDGSCIVSGSADKTVRVWDIPTGTLVRRIVGHMGVVYSTAVSSDGRLIVSSSADKTIRVWDSSTGQLVRSLTGHAAIVWSAAFSEDHHMVVSGSSDETVRLWDVGTGQPVHTCKGHTGVVYSASFSRDGRRLVSGAEDRTVCLWAPDTGQLLHRLVGHNGFVYSASFSSDGRRVVSGSGDNTVLIWDVTAGASTSYSPPATALLDISISAGSSQSLDATPLSRSSSRRSTRPETNALAMSGSADLARFLASVGDSVAHYTDQLVLSGCDSMFLLSVMTAEELKEQGLKPFHIRAIQTALKQLPPTTLSSSTSSSAVPPLVAVPESRMLDVLAEDGDIRSPLARIFAGCGEVLPLGQALRRVAELIPSYPSTLELVQKKARQVLRRHPEYAAGLDDNLAAYVLMYCYESQPKTQSLYFLMSKALRALRRDGLEEWVDYVWGLLHALKALPPSSKTTMYRGCKGTLQELGPNYVKGEEVTWYGFSSCSATIEAQEVFTGNEGNRVMFHIQMHSHVARDIQNLSWFPTESELLLPPGMRFRVESIGHLSAQLTMVQLEEVGMDDVIVDLR